MTVIHAPNVTDKFVTHFIYRTAKALVNEGTFPRSDEEDIAQELHMALIAQAKNFNPDKARWSTFVKNVVRNTAVSLRRRQRAQRRKSDMCSLNVLIEGADGELVELGATVSEEEHRTGTGQDFISHAEQVDAALDVQDVLESLPAELREICQRLKYHTATEVRRELGISRTTMRRRMETLRSNFRAAGIEGLA